MIFQCKDNITWDTWMYFYENKYYLYYLITNNSGGEGFGVAVERRRRALYRLRTMHRRVG